MNEISVKTWRSWVAAAALCCVAVSAWDDSAFAAPKKKSKADSKKARVLKVGDQVKIHINGDESKLSEGVSKSGVATADTLALPVRAEGFAAKEVNEETDELYRKAIEAGDQVGIDNLIRGGQVVKLKAGTKAVTIQYPYPTYPVDLNFHVLPVKAGGVCDIRITEGPSKGKACKIPVRNLMPAAP